MRRTPTTIVCLLSWTLAAQTPAPLRIEPVQPSRAPHACNAVSPRPLAVRVVDREGRPVPQASVTFRLPAEGPSGRFASGMLSERLSTDADGKATVYGIRWNGTQGRLQLSVTAEAAGAVAASSIAAEVSCAVAVAKGERPPDLHLKTPSSGKKWWLVGLAAGGALAALAVAGGSAGSSPTVATPMTPLIVAPSLGTPTITIGRP